MGKLKFPMPIGFVAPGFERVLEVFSDKYAKCIEKGSSFAAYYKGQPVVNIWGGLADWEVKRAWQEDTMGLFHSTTKFMASVTMAHLIERNVLKYEEKVSKYWPEFAQNGKEDVTIEQLLAYRGGVPALSEDFHIGWMRDDPKRLQHVLAKQKPLYPPNQAHGYHPITEGLYLNEIVKRVDRKGRTLSQYFHDEIAVPFGIDFYIGCPKPLQHRVARLEPFLQDKERLADILNNFKGNVELYTLAFSQPKDWTSPRSLNDPEFLELPVPSSHGAGTALAVAKFMGILANGGQHDGKVLLQPESIARLQEPMSDGVDLTTGLEDIYGRGTWLIPVIEGDQNWFMFGKAGYGDQIGMADPHYKTGFAYTTNRIVPMITYFDGESKWRPLAKALFQCIHIIEGVQVERKILSTAEDLTREKQKLLQKSKL